MSLTRKAMISPPSSTLLIVAGTSLSVTAFASGVPSLRWDNTTLSALGIVASIIASAAWLKADVKSAKEDVAEMKPAVNKINVLDTNVADMKPKVEKIEILVQQMADSREWMARIETGYKAEIARLERRIEVTEHTK